jgi:hypothetical protein
VTCRGFFPKEAQTGKMKRKLHLQKQHSSNKLRLKRISISNTKWATRQREVSENPEITKNQSNFLSHSVLFSFKKLNKLHWGKLKI